MQFRDADKNRAFLLNQLVGLASSVFLTVFSLNALFRGEAVLGSVLGIATILVLAALLFMNLSGNAEVGANAISLGVVILFAYLLIAGGVADTGPLWCYPLVLIVTILQGFRRGSAVVIGLVILAMAILYYPHLPFEVARYPDEFKLRFVASFIALGSMSLIYEYLRRRSGEQFRAISHELDKVSRTDMLTGLSNRRDMQEQLEVARDIYRRHGHVFSLVMLDLDHFKQINDVHGHEIGDLLLKAVAQCLTSQVRQQDLVARWGGEEFLILLPQTQHEQAVALAEKLRKALARVHLADSSLECRVTASFGVQAAFPGLQIAELLSRVDRLLYQAKHHGRDCVVGATPTEVNLRARQVTSPS